MQPTDASTRRRAVISARCAAHPASDSRQVPATWTCEASVSSTTRGPIACAPAVADGATLPPLASGDAARGASVPVGVVGGCGESAALMRAAAPSTPRAVHVATAAVFTRAGASTPPQRRRMRATSATTPSPSSSSACRVTSASSSWATATASGIVPPISAAASAAFRW